MSTLTELQTFERGVEISNIDIAGSTPTVGELNTAFPDAYNGFLGVIDDNGAGSDIFLYLRANGQWQLLADSGVPPGSGVSSVTAGAGLTGGGSGAVNLDVGAGAGISVLADSIAISLASPSGLNTSSGLAVDNSIAGSGLTIASKVLAVGAGNGITVNANDVALTTPGTLSVSSTNVAAGNHTHAITASANPGAASALLKSDAGGGLILQALTVQGSVDITTSGNLTVGTNVLFVNNTGQRVGINTAPDAQFALDINGNIRWSGWGVGKMALQVEGALLICHFDGKAPYETDYTGVAIGHKGQALTWNNGIIFRPGKFGKAVQFAPATVNLILDSSFEGTISNWGNTGFTTHAQDTASCYIGSTSLLTTPPSSPTGQSFSQQVVTVSALTDYTLSVWINTTSDDYTLSSQQVGGSTVTTHTPITGSAGWQRVTQTITTVTGTTSLRVRLRHAGTVSSDVSARWDGVQLEQKAYATPYCDGSLDVVHPDGTTGQHSFSGTPHASTSTRTGPAAFSLPTEGNIYEAAGTIAAWLYSDSVAVGAGLWPTVVRLDGTGSGFLIFRVKSTDGKFVFNYGSATISDPTVYPTGQWVHFAATWDASNLRLYRNGVEVDSDTNPGFDGWPTTMGIGVNPGGGNVWNGLIDELVILDRAAPADEIRAIYESNAPVFAETSSFQFTVPNQLVWADENGLFMRANDGSAAFGIVGVDGYSWGGQAMNSGDLLLGNTSDANFFFDISAGVFNLRSQTTVAIQLFATADSAGRVANFDGVVGINTNGGIFQGTGTFASPTTGLKISNSSGIGRIQGYNSGTLQAEFATDGKIKAGAGDVVLSNDGADILNASSTLTVPGLAGRAISWYPGTTISEANRLFSIEGWRYSTGGDNYGILEVNQPAASTDDAILLLQVGDDTLMRFVGAGTTGSEESHISFNFGPTADTFRLNEAQLVFVPNSANSLQVVYKYPNTVAHGMTTLNLGTTTTDTFVQMGMYDGAAGGFAQTGLTESVVGQYLASYHTTDNTDKTTSANGSFVFDVYKKSGSTFTNPGANANLFVIKRGASARFIVDVEGDIHYDGTANTFDEFDDVGLVRLAVRETAIDGVIESEFDRFVTTNREQLGRMGLVTFNKDGHHFVNLTRMQQLHSGAIWQLHERLAMLERRFLHD